MPASTVTSSAVVGSSNNKQTRLRQQRHRDDHALLLSAGELMRIGGHDALGVRYLHLGEHVLCSNACLRRVTARDGSTAVSVSCDPTRRLGFRADIASW